MVTADYFTIHDGSFLMVSFSGPRMVTPHVLWPTPRYLQENNICFIPNKHILRILSRYTQECQRFYLSATSTRFLWVTAKSLSLWLCFISSVTPLRNRPIPAKATKQIDLIWRQHIRSTTGVAQKHQEKGLVTKMEISDCRRLNVLKISEVKWSYRSSQLPSGRITSSRGGRVSPLFDGATGESTAENTDSLASSMSCWVNCPDLAQSTPRRNADKVCTEFGSLRDTRRITSGRHTFYTSLLFSILIHLFIF